MTCRRKLAGILAAVFFFVIAAAGQSPELVAKSQRARDMMAAGRFEEAIPVYLQLVQALPDNPGLLLNLGLARHMAGHDREAALNFEAVLRSQPKLLPALISLGECRLSTGETRKAIAPLERALAIEPDSLSVLGLLAGALMDLGNFAQSAAHYRRLTSLSHGDTRAWYALGMSYESIATAAFERLQKLDLKSPWVSALVADTRVQRRQYRSAFFFYEEALKNLPNLPGIHASLAGIYRKTGHEDWAAEEDAKEHALPSAADRDLLAAVMPLPVTAPPEALYWQASAANELALQAFSQLGKLPPSVELHRFQADVARNQNQHMEAVKEWRAALELAPADPRLRYEMTVSLFMARDFRSAFDAALALLRSMPREAELNFIAGDSLLRLEEPEKAIPYLRTALAADPKLLAANASIGLSLCRLGKNAEAVPHLEKSLELDDDGSLHYQLARAYQASGNPEKSRIAMAKYQEILKRNQDATDELAREAQISPPR